MPGYVKHDELPRWLHQAKLCLFPQDISLGGRFPIKLVEYMACGRPIVATNASESWPVKEAGAGLTVPPSVEEIASAIISLL